MRKVKHRPEAAKTIIASVTWKGKGECDTHLSVFDHERGGIVQTIIIPDHYVMAFDLSPDGRMVAAGFWEKAPQVRIWDVTSSEQIRSFSSFGVSGIYFDKTSHYVIYKSERGTYAKEIFGDGSQQILHVEDVRSGSFSATDTTFWVPLKRKSTLVCLDFAPLAQHKLQLPISTVISQLCHSPTTDAFFALDGKKTVHYFARRSLEPLWLANLQSYVPDKYVTYGQYCGNGTLIGMTAMGSSKISTIVLRTDTGEVQHIIDDGAQPAEQPFAETEVLSIWGGTSLDLRTGEKRTGLSHLDLTFHCTLLPPGCGSR